jgi:hypothetical protein
MSSQVPPLPNATANASAPPAAAIICVTPAAHQASAGAAGAALPRAVPLEVSLVASDESPATDFSSSAVTFAYQRVCLENVAEGVCVEPPAVSTESSTS